jgi:two-component system, response regulator PdtaR
MTSLHHESTNTALHHKRPQILVVEDEILVRMSVTAHLRHSGYGVVEAGMADEACQIILAGTPIDVLFTDIAMPGSMDGIALTRWVHHARPATKTIVGSAYDRLADAAYDLCHPDAVIRKPYDYEALLDELRRLAPADEADAVDSMPQSPEASAASEDPQASRPPLEFLKSEFRFSVRSRTVRIRALYKGTIVGIVFSRRLLEHFAQAKKLSQDEAFTTIVNNKVALQDAGARACERRRAQAKIITVDRSHLLPTDPQPQPLAWRQRRSSN